MNKEKELESLKKEIKYIEDRNPYSGEWSFLYWQLYELEKELEEANKWNWNIMF